MALYLVTTLADEAFDGVETATAPDGAGLSLREALSLANADPDSTDAITFDASLKGGTLTLTQGELVISGNTSIDGDIDDDKAFDITVDADGASRGMHVTTTVAYVAVSLDGLRITGGYAVQSGYGSEPIGAGVLVETSAEVPFGYSPISLALTNSRLDGNTVAGGYSRGGALGIARGTAVLDNVDIVDNAAAGIAAAGSYSNYSFYGATLQITDSTVANNDRFGIIALFSNVDATDVLVDGNGAGGIAIGSLPGYFSGLTLTDSIVSNNTGGGISVSYASAIVRGSLIHGNTTTTVGAGIGLGIYSFGGVYDSVISGNTASRGGGGIPVTGGYQGASGFVVSGSRIEGNSAPVGGGAYVDPGGAVLRDGYAASTYAPALPGSMWLNNHATESGGAIAVGPFSVADLHGSLVAGNTAGEAGGGIANDTGYATLTNATVTENSAALAGGIWTSIGTYSGVTEVQNTILAGNSSGAGPADSVGPLVLAGGNIAGGTAYVGTTPVRTGITPAMIFAQGCAEPPGTLLAGPDNPALDAGDDALAPGTTDLAGDPRLVDLPGVANNGANVVDLGARDLQELPPSATTITVHAAGERFQGNPAFSLYVDGALVAANVTVPSAAGPRNLPQLRRAAVPFEFEVDGPVDEIEIVFANDLHGRCGDRNLFIREVAVDELILTPKRHGDFDPDGPAKPNIVNAAENHGLIYVNGTLTLTLPEDTLI